MTPTFLKSPILAIETSCDETSAAVVVGSKALSNVVSSQIDLHARTGGVVPEVAARAHVEAIVPIVDQALFESGFPMNQIYGIAVTNRPGLIGALSVGVTAAKALAFAYSLPLIGVHHLEGHLMSPAANDANVPFPHLCLLVSGGHTELVLVSNWGEYEIVGGTRDDAAGEAFDKSARLLGFPYPGGRALSDAAVMGDPGRYPLPEALKNENTLDWSFSGLKTAVLRLTEKEGENLSIPDAAASVQEAIISALARRVESAVERFSPKAVTLAGGVAANRPLRDRLSAVCNRRMIDFLPAPLELCTDNAAMIGIAGSFRLALGDRSDMSLDCLANADLPAGVAL